MFRFRRSARFTDQRLGLRGFQGLLVREKAKPYARKPFGLVT